MAHLPTLGQTDVRRTVHPRGHTESGNCGEGETNGRQGRGARSEFGLVVRGNA